MKPPIELRGVNTHNASVLAALFPLYCHELSVFGDLWRLDVEACWQPNALINYWLDPPANARSLLLYEGGTPMGFILMGLDGFPYKQADCQYHLSECFVVKYRRSMGFGKEAIQMLLPQYPGNWGLEVLKENVPALNFWRKVLPPLVGNVIEKPTDDAYHLSFTVTPLGSSLS